MPYLDTGAPEAALAPSPALERDPQEPPWSSARSLRKRLLKIVGASASCGFLIGVSARLVDRPVATWVHEHLGDSRSALFMMSYEGHQLAIGPFSFMAGPAEALGPLALSVLVLLVLAAMAERRPGRLGRIALVLSLSVLVAMHINSVAKLAFGRTWPESWLGDNPSWVRDGVFGFFPFHGGSGWGSFPSGHTTVITTLATLLWLVWPKLRILWAAMVTLVITGLIGANYHFVSDIIGGIFLGVTIGFSGAGLTFGPEGRFGRPIEQRASSTGQHMPVSDEIQSRSSET